MLDPLSLKGTLLEYLRAVGWSVAAAVGFAFGVGIALKVFDWLSTDIEEWEEINKGNWYSEVKSCSSYCSKLNRLFM